jgi:hypothetical protein
MWRLVDLVWTDVSEEGVASIFRVEKSASEEPAWAGGYSLRNIPEDGILHSHRRENLKSYIYENGWWNFDECSRFQNPWARKRSMYEKILNGKKICFEIFTDLHNLSPPPFPSLPPERLGEFRSYSGLSLSILERCPVNMNIVAPELGALYIGIR